MKTILKYFRIYQQMFKTSLIADLEYRANFFTQIFSDTLWYASQIVTFEVLYLHTDKIGDWGLPEMRIFLGLVFIIDALYSIVFFDNLDNFSEKVKKGDLDLILSKPVNAQFMVSLQKANTSLFGNLLLGSGWFIYAISIYPDFQMLRLLWLLLLIPCSLTIMYTIRFFFACLCVIFTQAQNLQFVWWQLYRLGLRPDSIYPMKLRIFLLTIFPIATLISVPARALINPADFSYLLLPIIIAPLFLYFSHRFWRFSLKFYSSASS